MSWHATTGDLERYARSALSSASAASLEAHLTSCAECRTRAAGCADTTALQRIKSSLDLELDAPTAAFWERGLRRVGLSEPSTRLLAATASLEGSWVVAGLIAAGFALAAATTTSSRVALALFLVLAPVVPLLGVALAFGPRVDPAHEITVASPMPVGRIVLLRSIAVLGVSLPLLAALTLLLPGPWSLAFAWLLPALGLAAISLALGSFLPVTRAAAGLAVVWVVVAGIALTGAPRTSAEAFARGFVAFRPAGQVAFAVVTVAAGLVAIARRFAVVNCLERVSP